MFGFSKNIKLLLIMVATFSLCAGAYMVLLNLYLVELGYKESFVGQVTGLISVGTMLTTIPVAWLCGRYPVKWIIFAAVLSNFFGDILLIQAASPETLRLGALLAGGSMGAWMIASAPFIMRNAKRDERGAVFSYKHGLGMIGSGVAAITFAKGVDWLVAAGYSGSESYQLVLSIATGLKLVTLMLSVFIKAQAPLADERRDIKDFVVSRDWSSLIKLVFPIYIIGCGAGLTMPFMNLYFKQRFELNTGDIGMYFFVCQFFMALGTLIGPRFARTRGNMMVVVLTQFFSLPFMLILAFTGNIAWAVGAFFIRATLMNMGHPLYHHFSMEIVEPKEQAVTNAMIGLGWNAGWFMSSWIGGIVIEKHGFTPTILATAAFYLIATLVQLKLFSRPSYKSIGQTLPVAKTA